jgi:hypothetical protein
MNYLTIGVAGQLFSGKDTFSDYVCDKLNLNPKNGHWVRKGFAHAVKKVYMDTFNVNWDFIEKWKRIPEAPPGFEKSVRDSLIYIGDGFRSIMPNVWIEIAFRDAKYNQIISDVRYVNEAEYIRSHGGFTVLMWRPGHENEIKNESEQQLVPYIKKIRSRKKNFDCVLLKEKNFPFDMFVINEGDLISLYKKLDKFVMPQVIQWAEHLAIN